MPIIWLTAADVMRLLKISESTFYRLQREKVIVPTYFGKSPRYLEADIHKLRDSQFMLKGEMHPNDPATGSGITPERYSAQQIEKMSTEDQVNRVRFVFITWAVVIPVIIFTGGGIYDRFSKSFSEGGSLHSLATAEKIIFWGVILIYLVWGAIRPVKLSVFILKTIAGVVKYTWLFALVVIALKQLAKVALNWADTAGLVFILVTLSLLSYYTVSVLAAWEATDELQDA